MIEIEKQIDVNVCSQSKEKVRVMLMALQLMSVHYQIVSFTIMAIYKEFQSLEKCSDLYLNVYSVTLLSGVNSKQGFIGKRCPLN